MPGLRLNVSKSGLGLSVGPRGASVSLGPRGAYSHVGIPGTGIAYRQRLSSGGGNGRTGMGHANAPVDPDNLSDIVLRLDSEGKLEMSFEDGSPLTPTLVRKVRSAHADALRARLEDWAARRNEELHACLGIHLDTPAPLFEPYRPADPPPMRPEAPVMREVGFWDKLFLQRTRIEAENAAAQTRHEQAMVAWQAESEAYAAMLAELQTLNNALHEGEAEAMSAQISSRLSAIAWARPTEVCFDFGDDLATLALDIDLPESDAVPDTEWEVAARGLSVREKKRSATQKRRDFSYLAHASLFRIAGEAFASLPTLQEVTLGGYTQRPDPATGGTRDVHILSVKIARAEWEAIRFDRLEHVDVAEALDRFALIRNQTRTGELREITPHPA
ncbi:MAG: DUF4236 domain-containing protein [Salinarimonas sp.]|nr:DUF4236 domain-containing protein [Salinarimonas sp.]